MHFALPNLLLDHSSPHFYVLLVDYSVFFSWPHCTAREILVPRPRVKSMAAAVETES